MTAHPRPLFAAPAAPPAVEQAAPDAPAPGASGAQPDLAEWLTGALGTLTRANEVLREGIVEAKYEIARLLRENDRLRGELAAMRDHPSNQHRRPPLGGLRVVDGGGA